MHPGRTRISSTTAGSTSTAPAWSSLTEGDGTHTVEFSPDRKFLIDTYSRVDLPPVTELRQAEDGKLVCELERADASALLATGWQVARAVRRQGARRQDRHLGVIFRPTNFDPDEEVSGDREHLRRAAGLVRAQDVRAVSPARRRWPSWASSSCRSTAWARNCGRRRSTTSAGRTSATPASPTASSGSRRRPRSIRAWT